jgi:hypothetical protein
MPIVTLLVTDVRQDITTAWYYPPEVHRLHIRKHWLETGRLLGIPVETFSQDGLTRKLTATFRDEQSFTDWSKDPERMREHLPMIAYNTSNGIIRSMERIWPDAVLCDN